MIFRSPYPDVRVPDVALHRFVLAGAVERADQPALIDGPSGRALTYGQLAAGVERLAAGLTARGFRRGDVLALFMPNLPEFALAFQDRKSTRLNSSHVAISYAVFCLKK